MLGRADTEMRLLAQFESGQRSIQVRNSDSGAGLREFLSIHTGSSACKLTRFSKQPYAAFRSPKA